MSALLHSGHDYEILKSRWAALCKRNGWKVTELSEEGGYPVLAIENPAASEEASGGLYISAGVHGDECAPVWGLLQWAEESGNAEIVDNRPLVILPCLNPFGLVENTRLDSRGDDLNRNFQNTDIPLIKAWQQFLNGRRFDTGLNLHEDFDASGIYLYEVTRRESLGETLLAACEDIIPRETADSVDGSTLANGLLNRTDNIEQVVEEDLDGWPETIWLHLHHATDSFTFETPSEMELSRRIKTHRRFVEAVVENQQAWNQ